jgi:hypothetical protein
MYQKDTPAMQSKTFRHGLLHVNAMELVKLGDTNLETFKELMRHFAAGQKAVKAIIAAIGEPVVEPFPNYESSDAEWHREPAVGYQSEPDPSRTGGMQFGLSGGRAGMTSEDMSSIRAPPFARKRGRPRQNRFLSPLETKRKKRKHSVARPGYVQQSKFCSNCRSPHHTSANCHGTQDVGVQKKKRAKCSSCGLAGHKKNQCLSKTPVPEEYEDSDEGC